MFDSLIYGMFALFVILGVLFGLKRGLTKSLIRFITVVATCFLVVFTLNPLTSAILTADISGAGLVVGEIPVTSINEAIVNYISQISIVAQLLSTSPTLTALVNAIPAILVNLILFVLLFFIAKGILYFVDVIINKIVIIKDSDAPKRRLLGAVIGGVQGLICFLFVFMPIAGTMNLVTDTLSIVNTTESTTSAQSLTAVSLQSTSAVEVEDGEAMELDEFKVHATSAMDEYNNNLLIKLFNTIGYRAISNAVYDKITTIEISKDVKTTLRNETIVIAKVYNNYEKIKDVDISKFSKEDEKNAHALIDDAFSSPIIGGIATELTTGLSNAWTAVSPSAFAGVEKPVMDERLIETFDTLLINLRTDTKEDLKKDLKVIVSTIKVSADYNVTENIVNTANADSLVQALGKEGCMESVIGTLSTGKVTKAILPSVIEYGLSYGYTAVGLDGVEPNITKTADEVNWETEKVVLGDMFEGVSGTYISTKNEGELLEKLDFNAFAKTMTAIRDSELLSGAGQTITIHLLNSKLMLGIDTSTLEAYVSNSSTYSKINFNVMFTTLKSSAEIATDLKDITSGTGEVENLSTQDVSNLIAGLTGDDATKDILKGLATSQNLEKAGVDGATAGAVGVLVNSIADYDTSTDGAVQPPSTDQETNNASNAMESILTASKNSQDSNTAYIFSDDETTAKAKMTEFVTNLLSSDFIYATTINKGEELGFKTDGVSNLSANEQTWLKAVLDTEKASNPSCTAEKATAIALMFGVAY